LLRRYTLKLEKFAHGGGFLLEAESMKRNSWKYGLSVTFEADLEVAVRTFEKAIQDVRDATGRRSSSLRKWNESLGQTLDALGRLDILVPTRSRTIPRR
jgi:hypothetical protein